MSDYKPKVGDRVRVVIDDEVEHVLSNGDIETENHFVGIEHVVSIEKIEPPVEVFKPGDVVRSKAIARFRYVIGRDGYFSFQGNDFREHDEEFMEQSFTSERYERVELG